MYGDCNLEVTLHLATYRGINDSTLHYLSLDNPGRSTPWSQLPSQRKYVGDVQKYRISISTIVIAKTWASLLPGDGVHRRYLNLTSGRFIFSAGYFRTAGDDKSTI